MIAAIIYAMPFLMNGLADHARGLADRRRPVARRRRACSASASSTARCRCAGWSRLFTDIIRGIPILVLIFFVYYGLPPLGPQPQLLLGRRAGADAVQDRAGHRDTCAARSSRSRAARWKRPRRSASPSRSGSPTSIFPQAVRRFLPPWINGVTDAVKGSALVSLLGIVDLMLAIQQVIGRTYEPMPLYVLGALHLLRDQLQPLEPQPPARAPLRLYPGMSAMAATAAVAPAAFAA